MLVCILYILLSCQGADNCLEGLTFVITGVLESLERDEMKALIERYSGRVTGSVSGKTSFLILGEDAGESKIQKVIYYALCYSTSLTYSQFKKMVNVSVHDSYCIYLKAKKLKVKELTEDGLLNMIKSKPPKRSKYDIKLEKEIEKEKR